MPVIGSPIAKSSCRLETTIAADLNTAAAKTTRVYGVPAVEKLKSVTVRVGQEPFVLWTFTNDDGAAIDLTTVLNPDYGSLSSLSADVEWLTSTSAAVLRCREFISGQCVTEFAATVVSPTEGKVRAQVDPIRMGGPGIYFAEFAVLDVAGTVVVSSQFLLTVERGLFKDVSPCGPPSVAEIRLHLRDSSPAEQRLIDTVTFDDAEIAACVARPVLFWNEALPPVAPFSTENFPFRYHWMEGIKANLFWIAAEYYRKNHLQYQAGGVAVDDLNKAAEYDAKAAEIWQEYKAWVQQRKIVINIEMGYGILASEYSYLSGYANPFGSY